MEEIDIIELLQRVKEGKAPKKIEIHGKICEFEKYERKMEELYSYDDYGWFTVLDITFDTPIKILDKPKTNKPKLEKFYYDDTNMTPNEKFLADKIIEIIDILNKENKDE